MESSRCLEELLNSCIYTPSIIIIVLQSATKFFSQTFTPKKSFLLTMPPIAVDEPRIKWFFRFPFTFNFTWFEVWNSLIRLGFCFLFFRNRIVYTALHVLLINAMLIAFIFTQIASGRDDNDTVVKVAPSPSNPNPEKRPVLRLTFFGVSFLSYLVVKAFQLVIPDTWFHLKKYTDELTLLIGCVSLILLVSTTTIDFALKAMLPALCVMIVGRFCFGEKVIEWLYILYLRIKKGICVSGRYLAWAFLRTVFVDTAAATTAMATTSTHWNSRIDAARSRSRAASFDRRNRRQTARQESLVIVPDPAVAAAPVDLDAGNQWPATPHAPPPPPWMGVFFFFFLFLCNWAHFYKTTPSSLLKFSIWINKNRISSKTFISFDKLSVRYNIAIGFTAKNTKIRMRPGYSVDFSSVISYPIWLSCRLDSFSGNDCHVICGSIRYLRD